MRWVILVILGLAHYSHGFRSCSLASRTMRSRQQRMTSDENSSEGQPKLPATPKVWGMGSEAEATEPAFRRRRTPAPITDNLIVLFGTCSGLVALIVAFLYLNRDVPPPPYTY